MREITQRTLINQKKKKKGEKSQKSCKNLKGFSEGESQWQSKIWVSRGFLFIYLDGMKLQSLSIKA